ncbi:MAG: hypothetical protein Q7S04_01420 [Candidatus Moranbacteria bacterium]|nr:hypothetical protein [Candidatus Moranbacteria bacterium]
MKHFEMCDAPICADREAYENNPNWQKTVSWHPGEAVCGMKPYAKWQKRQTKINRWLLAGKLKYPELFFTVETLLRKKLLYRGIKGDNPDAEIG